MLIKYIGSVMPAQESENRVAGIAWSPNNLKIAVASSDRSIYLFDNKGAKKDRFSTKPVDSKYGKKSYIIKGIAFSPDSTKIAVGQTDNMVYVYKIGEEWGEKKVICNKFSQTSSVTCLIWPLEGPIIVGLADGKVRAAIIKANKAQTLYTADAMTIALAANVRGTGFISSHADGSIIRYYISDDGNAEPSGRVVTHSVPAYALAWPQNYILAAGCDKKITFYEARGKVSKIFDHSRDSAEKEMTVACCSPSGQSVAIGSWDKVRIIDYSPRRAVWEEAIVRSLPNLYTVTALAWRRDGSRLVVGGLCGAVEQFETILRRSIVRGSYEVAYVGPSQVVVRPLKNANNSKTQPIIIRSQTGGEIEDVRILGRRDTSIVAKTPTTLLLGDIELNLISEIPWEEKGVSEKFFFEFPGVCLIFCSGELTIVEYGKNEILGSVRTEAVNPHVVSVRINERPGTKTMDNKRVAYLLDPRTARIVDLVSNSTISIISHDVKIDWLELSETGHRLLSRDKRGRLWLSDDQGGRHLLMTGVSFASWIPNSDVIVAQSGQSLSVWYNVDVPDAITQIPIRGDAVDIVREDGRTSVMVDEQSGQIAYQLDEGLIEFGTALHDNDFGRVVLFLEDFSDGPQAEAMWENVARNAMATRQLQVAARCYVALGDVAKARFLKDIIETSERYALETGNDPEMCPDYWAKLAILNGELKTAEVVYLEQNELDKALDMYQKYWHWEDALSLAQSRGWSGLREMKKKYLKWLSESGQETRAAAVTEHEDPRKAVKLYLEARRPGRAARLVLEHKELLEDDAIIDDLVRGLKEADLMELNGEILEKTSRQSEAIKCYVQAGAFARALELARKIEPNAVVELEKQWGEHLAANGHNDAAINHFIEAGETASALNSAIEARQWRKALQIIQVIEDDDPDIKKHCVKLGEYFASIGDKSLAESLFLRAGKAQQAIDIQIQSGNWSRAHELAMQHMSVEESNQVLNEHAETLQKSGDLRQAELLLLATGQHDAAISMYKNSGSRNDMIRLVAKYRPDFLQSTHALLAREMVAAGKPREAEEHFIGAGDYRGAINAYKTGQMWEDALRVAKQSNLEKAAPQVALLWARTLSPELGARLLMRLHYFDPCLQLACEANLFDWALEIVKYGTEEQKKEVYYRHAIALEDEGRLPEAEREFLRAGKPMEAVQMYIHNKNYEAAEEIAKTEGEDALMNVLVARATEAVEKRDYSLAESLLLRARKPEIIIEHYKNGNMWSEAMRVCREYLPTQEAALRREMTHRNVKPDSNHSIDEAERWMEVGEVRSALRTLLADPEDSRDSALQAADILLHQAEPEVAIEFGRELGQRLFNHGEHALAAQVFLQADKLKEAVNALTAVGEWQRAKRIVQELAPELEPYLDEKYREAAINDGESDRIIETESYGKSPLDALAKKGQWDKVFEEAKKQSPEVLHKFVAQRAAYFLKSNTPLQALQLYVQYEAPPMQQNFNLYHHLAETVLNTGEVLNNYVYLSQMRNVILGLVKSLQYSSSVDKFEKLLKASHHAAVYCACSAYPSLSTLFLKTSISLLRYTDVLHADRCYYNAGLAARTAGLNSEAFVFLNHFLDLEECIEEGDGSILDIDDLRVTDFPLEVPLPSSSSLSREEREEVREWVLAVSMDQRVEQGLPVDQRGVYIGSLTNPNSTLTPLQECALSGFPLRGPTIRFESNSFVADRDEWNKLINTAKREAADSTLNDILAFMREWCGAVPNYSF